MSILESLGLVVGAVVGVAVLWGLWHLVNFDSVTLRRRRPRSWRRW